MPTLSRRDFLRLAAAAAAGMYVSPSRSLANLWKGDVAPPNIIIILMDTMSARHLSLYGYGRPTTPNFEKLAESATVYHAHHAGGNFTVPGTASMLTGLYPWTHRAMTVRSLIKRSVEQDNMFALAGTGYHRLAFSQNLWVDVLLGQIARDVDERLPSTSFSYRQNLYRPQDARFFASDYPIAYMAFEDHLTYMPILNKRPGSISLGLLDLLTSKTFQDMRGRGYDPNSALPTNFYTDFRIEDLMKGISRSLALLSERNVPFFAYYHLLPPHDPYRPSAQFKDIYRDDGFPYVVKPTHPLAYDRELGQDLSQLSTSYDEFITNLDHEFSLLVENLEASGILDNSYLIVTSDHGELNERGESGHGTPLMYESVTHIPLIIRAPGQKRRVDVRSLTSNIDLLPTILHLTGRPSQAGLEGQVLPGLGGTETPERSVFSVWSLQNSAFLPLTKAVISMHKSHHKLIYYRGYPGYDDKYEFYDLENDPEELNNLVAAGQATANLARDGQRMRKELLETLAAADRPYQK